VAAELTLEGGELGDGRAFAAELDGNGGGQQAAVAKGLEGLAHDAALTVVAGGMLGEARAEGGSALGEGHGSGRKVHGNGCCSSHDRSLLRCPGGN
jgi:hypothetical protein